VVLGAAAASAEEAKTEKKAPDPREVGTWAWGVKGGVNLGNLYGRHPNPSANTEDPTMHLGVALGAFATWRITGELALQPELYMSEKGAEFKDLSDQDLEEAYLYLELPVLARYSYSIDDTFQVFGVLGPSFNYLIDSKAREKDELSPFDLAVTAGVGTDIKVGKYLIIVDARYSMGLLNTIDTPGSNEAYTRVLTILLGFTT